MMLMPELHLVAGRHSEGVPHTEAWPEEGSQCPDMAASRQAAWAGPHSMVAETEAAGSRGTARHARSVTLSNLHITEVS